MSESLPPPTSTQAYCNISALESGFIELPQELYVTNNSDPQAVISAPSLSFLLKHSEIQSNFLFDLGIRKDWENYPPMVVDLIRKKFPVCITQDVVESLAKGEISPLDIQDVCLSHCHFDHVGDTKPFVRSTFLVGAGTSALLDSGYPTNPRSTIASEILPISRTKFLEPTGWSSLGPFPRALDFHGDGSLYIVDSPGHIAGHITILARTSSDGSWIYLAGDSVHHWDLITGESDIEVLPHRVHKCAHEDKKAAEEHILRIRALCKLPRVQIILAHDESWYKSNKGMPVFWPGKIQSL
ncbi:Metallo-hydrolase/oxidoreductase [Collybia nuda]|uniref:Metallo-hydrolase/oxidoreductase n=1 Tax=Collybia nuda TaxID=64659 RepID=A0A9P5YJ73_9AGAR|nr:Metallo-hydrolase/oxidoreductase [Collybia nuda]